ASSKRVLFSSTKLNSFLNFCDGKPVLLARVMGRSQNLASLLALKGFKNPWCREPALLRTPASLLGIRVVKSIGCEEPTRFKNPSHSTNISITILHIFTLCGCLLGVWCG